MPYACPLPTDLPMQAEVYIRDNGVPHFYNVWDLDPTLKVEQEFRAILQSEALKALPTTDDRSKDLNLRQVEAMTQLARALGLQSKFNEAVDLLLEAGKLLKAQENNWDPVQQATAKARIELE